LVTSEDALYELNFLPRNAGMKEIILCKESRRHVKDINTDYITGLKFHYVGNMQQVLARAIS